MVSKRIYRIPWNSLVFLVAVLAVSQVFAQWSWNNRLTVRDDGLFMGGAGVAFIGDDSYFIVNLRTELVFGQFGVGVDVPLRFNTENGELRNVDWNDTYDYFRIIRYLRYGTKHRTPVYARLGTLDGARLGHGFIMDYYTNEANYDERKIGTEFDLKFDMWGMESVVSNYEHLEILGTRFYVLPLRKLTNLPMLNKLTFGFSYVTDRNPDEQDSTDATTTITGLDVGLPLVNKGPFFSSIYADYAKISGFGSGKAVGLELGLWKLGGILTLQAKLERRFLGKEFLPAYFNPFYEVEKVTKESVLALLTKSQKGYYGELLGDVLNIVRLMGAYERIDDQPQSGRLHLAALLSKSLPRISARGVYDRTDIKDFGDTFALDERSILRAGVGYQINAFLYLFTDYIWTFTVDGATGQLETQRRVEPQLTFVMPLNFGGK